MSLIIDERTEGSWRVLVVVGELDLFTVPTLRSALMGALGAAREVAIGPPRSGSRPPGVVVDLTEVTFMDSAGLGLLVAALKRARAEGTRLRLAGPTASVAQLFAITGLSRVFEVRPSLADAVAADGAVGGPASGGRPG